MSRGAAKLGLFAFACGALLDPHAAGADALARPDAVGAEACDCRVEVEVPVYEMGRIVRWQREPRLIGRHPQCCRK